MSQSEATIRSMCHLQCCSAHLSAALCSSPHRSCVSSQMKQCLVKYGLHTDDVFLAYSHALALLLCTSEHCIWTGRICCGCSAHQSHGLYHQMKQLLMIWGVQHVHHQLIMFYEHVASVSSHRMQRVSLHLAANYACIGVLHIWALCFQPSPDEGVVVRMLSSHHYQHWWYFMSVFSCDCFGLMQIWALY